MLPYHGRKAELNDITTSLHLSTMLTRSQIGRDVYANRDIQAYEKGRRDIEKLVKSFDKLPLDMSRFYLNRLADELKAKAQSFGL